MKRKVKRKDAHKIVFPLLSVILLTLSLLLTLILAFLLETKQLRAVIKYVTFASQNVSFEQPAITSITNTSAVIWLKTTSAVNAPVKIQLSIKKEWVNQDIDDIHSLVFQSKPINNPSGSNKSSRESNLLKAEVNNLAPNTIYYIGVYVSGSFIPFSSVPSFKTLTSDHF